jgi:hypothetical protein
MLFLTRKNSLWFVRINVEGSNNLVLVTVTKDDCDTWLCEWTAFPNTTSLRTKIDLKDLVEICSFRECFLHFSHRILPRM